MINIAVLGCTGSIGRQTLDVVRKNPGLYRVTGLSCGSDAEGLAALAEEFDCRTLGIAEEKKAIELKHRFPHADVYFGDEALTATACGAQTVVVAVVGMVGLKAVLAALGNNQTIALANKESLVAGGELVISALKNGGAICPVDSEHSAIWQCLRGEQKFSRIILTASGGPFFFTPLEEFDEITPEKAIAHPNWSMGKKISVDSATMMNKGLEIIEARWLFDTFDIEYVIHPESIVHSMVEFDDGSIKAQAGYPDMRLPIQYAITYPDHAMRDFTPLKLPMNLRFLPPDEIKFPAPRLAKEAMRQGGTACTVLNAANEAAVRLFLERKIGFTDIVKIVEKTLNSTPIEPIKDMDNIFETHKRVYDKIYLKQ